MGSGKGKRGKGGRTRRPSRGPGGGTQKARVSPDTKSLIEGPRTRARVYYIPNGYDYHIAELLRDLYTEVKPFGCLDVQDYIDRRVLAHTIPNASAVMVEEVRDFRPDIVYVESGYNIDPRALAFIRTQLGIPVTMWFGDACVNEEFVERVLHYAQVVDWQVVVDRRASDEAARRGIANVEFIPFLGYDHYFRPIEREKTIDVLFTGKSYENMLGGIYTSSRPRLEFVRRLDAELAGGLLVVGEGWEGQGLADYRPARVPEWEVNELNNAAKIVLAYDVCQVQDFTSCRTYHALLGRSFVITRKYPGIEKFFVNDEHLVWFEAEEEGIALVEHYLTRDDERERIAAAGLAHIQRTGWKFSNVVRYLVDKGCGREHRLFDELYASYRGET